MTTFNEWCLLTVQQVRTDIGPGVSGWDSSIEGQDIRTLIQTAEATIGTPPELGLPVSNRVTDQVVEELPGSAATGRQAEINANEGEFNAALIATEIHFQALVDEDDDELPAGPPPRPSPRR